MSNQTANSNGTKLWIFKSITGVFATILFAAAGFQMKEILAKDKSQDRNIERHGTRLTKLETKFDYIVTALDEIKKSVTKEKI